MLVLPVSDHGREFPAMASYLTLLRCNMLPGSSCTKGKKQVYPVPSKSQVAAVDTD